MRKALTLTADAEGNVFVAGPVREEDESPLFVAKLDPQGRVLWSRTIERHAPPWGFMCATPEEESPEDRISESPVRDSVSPIMVDVEIDALSRKLTWHGRLQRALGAAIAAVLVTLSLAGVATAQGRLVIGATPPAMMHATLGETIDTSELARLAKPLELDRTAYSDLQLAPAPSAAELRTEALALLNAGKAAEAVPVANAYVGAAPDDAHAYLCLGAALLELGRREEARATFRECVENATHGNIGECHALRAN